MTTALAFALLIATPYAARITPYADAATCRAAADWAAANLPPGAVALCLPRTQPPPAGHPAPAPGKPRSRPARNFANSSVPCGIAVFRSPYSG